MPNVTTETMVATKAKLAARTPARICKIPIARSQILRFRTRLGSIANGSETRSNTETFITDTPLKGAPGARRNPADPRNRRLKQIVPAPKGFVVRAGNGQKKSRRDRRPEGFRSRRLTRLNEPPCRTGFPLVSLPMFIYGRTYPSVRTRQGAARDLSRFQQTNPQFMG